MVQSLFVKNLLGWSNKIPLFMEPDGLITVSLPLDPIPGQLNPIYALVPHTFKSHLTL